MRIALIGYGKMGKEIERHAKEKGHTITEIFNRTHPLSASQLQSADVAIDFSAASAVIHHIEICAEAQKSIVVGTTGWNEHLGKVADIVKQNPIGLIYASNFSIGVNLFFKIVENAAALMNRYHDYDAFIHEIHHNQKSDSPSGTALSLAKILLQQLERKKEILTQPPEGKIVPEQLHVTSARTGSVPGTHMVGFDSTADTIELTHTARNRSGFALGAIAAAEWIHNKKGLFTISDMMNF